MARATAVWGRAVTVVRAAIGPLLLYDLLFKAVGLLVFAPLTAFALERLVATTGSLSVTNSDIAHFLLSPWGLLFLVLSMTLSVASLFAEQAGLMHIVAAAGRGQRPAWLAALRRVLITLPRLLSVAAVQVGILLLWLLPMAGIGTAAYAGLLGGHDINWYLAERPPELWLAVGIGALLVLAALTALGVLLVRWSLAVPACLFEGLSGGAALRRSRDLLRSHERYAALLVLGWVIVATIVSLLVLLLLDFGAGLLLSLISGMKPLIVVTALVLGLMTLAGAALSFIGFAGYSFVVIDLYQQTSDAAAPEESTDVTSPRAQRLGVSALVLVVLAATGISALITQELIEDLSFGRQVQVTAHRGSSRTAPENSLSAIRQAIADGADYAEIDIQETADGTLVLLHDTDLMRVAGLNAKIWEITYDEIQDLDAGSWFSNAFAGEPVPSLQQAMDLAQGRIRLNIELKYNSHDQRLAERTAELVRANGFVDQCVLTSLDYAGLQRVRTAAPEIRIGQIVTVAVGDAERLDVDFLSMNTSLASSRQVRANRMAGLDTHVWTVNDPEAMKRMIERGVANIITDEPALLRQLIDERTTLSDGELLLLALSARLRE